jgi:hypothetical protein
LRGSVLEEEQWPCEEWLGLGGRGGGGGPGLLPGPRKIVLRAASTGFATSLSLLYSRRRTRALFLHPTNSAGLKRPFVREPLTRQSSSTAGLPQARESSVPLVRRRRRRRRRRCRWRRCRWWWWRRCRWWWWRRWRPWCGGEGGRGTPRTVIVEKPAAPSHDVAVPQIGAHPRTRSSISTVGSCIAGCISKLECSPCYRALKWAADEQWVSLRSRPDPRPLAHPQAASTSSTCLSASLVPALRSRYSLFAYQ